MNLRTLLVLGRVSNLPTVWSNLLAGWMLARGGFEPGRLALLLLGGSFLYVGGMYLNDFCDAAFDAQHVPTRPIPAGRISRSAVGLFVVVWLGVGMACFELERETLGWALLLLFAIVIYNLFHKGFIFAPLVMGGCRFLLYPLAAAAPYPAPFDYVQGYVYGDGAALGLYVAGITYLARGESRPGKPARWALLFLLLPNAAGVAQWMMQGKSDTGTALSLCFFSIILLGWMAWLLIPLWTGKDGSIGRVVSGLLAGIVLVDALLLVPECGWAGLLLLPLFLAALALQRFVPAT